MWNWIPRVVVAAPRGHRMNRRMILEAFRYVLEVVGLGVALFLILFAALLFL